MEEEARRRCAHAWRRRSKQSPPPPPPQLGLFVQTPPDQPHPLYCDSFWHRHGTQPNYGMQTNMRPRHIRACDEREKIKLYLGLFRAAPAPKIQADFGILPRAFHRQMSIHSRVLPSMLWSTQREGRCDQSHWGWACLFCFFGRGGVLTTLAHSQECPLTQSSGRPFRKRLLW